MPTVLFAFEGKGVATEWESLLCSSGSLSRALNILAAYCKEKGCVLADIQREIHFAAKDLAK